MTIYKKDQGQEVINQSFKSKVLCLKSLVLVLLLLFNTCYLSAFAENKPILRPKIGLVLSGGGARGAAHIGVLRMLEKENIPVDYIVGSSVGALIGALYSGGVSTDELEKYAISGVMNKVYKTDFSVLRIILLPINKFLRTIIGAPFYAGLYNDHRLHNFVNQLVTDSDGNISISIPLHIIAVDLVSGKPVVIESGDIGLAVQASTAIPTLHRPIAYDDKLLIDGSVLKNMPVDEARKMGADIVIAINIDEKLEPKKKEEFRSFEGVITRIITLSLANQSETVLGKADVVIDPNLNGIGVLDLDTVSLSKAIKAGEEAALNAVPRIKEVINSNMQRLLQAKN
ncbi:MAG: patatin-like phospholipase family protein [Candidatus Melainabacteria bacterium]|nr:patatin-like phospholipase family protein [Candidatus Melainabacteria bacterium]MBI3308875.1 patatin-like phospholipase family protein [Candidatus Melainabacteria bacterium]